MKKLAFSMFLISIVLVGCSSGLKQNQGAAVAKSETIDEQLQAHNWIMVNPGELGLPPYTVFSFLPGGKLIINTRAEMQKYDHFISDYKITGKLIEFTIAFSTLKLEVKLDNQSKTCGLCLYDPNRELVFQIITNDKGFDPFAGLKSMPN